MTLTAWSIVAIVIAATSVAPFVILWIAQRAGTNHRSAPPRIEDDS
ncbi:hypothetical protein V8J82_02340 [Gymnodinialimonas sp. 2305UL16-5]